MGIKSNNIKIKHIQGLNKHKQNSIIIEATCQLTNDFEIDKITFDSLHINDRQRIENELKQSILHYTYGDLIQPINALIKITKCNAENNQQFQEIEEITAILNNVLHGE